jgi:hypothetical protein
MQENHHESKHPITPARVHQSSHCRVGSQSSLLLCCCFVAMLRVSSLFFCWLLLQRLCFTRKLQSRWVSCNFWTRSYWNACASPAALITFVGGPNCQFCSPPLYFSKQTFDLCHDPRDFEVSSGRPLTQPYPHAEISLIFSRASLAVPQTQNPLLFHQQQETPNSLRTIMRRHGRSPSVGTPSSATPNTAKHKNQVKKSNTYWTRSRNLVW